jgi:asparagine synthase (glutamine-hydrolysing)
VDRPKVGFTVPLSPWFRGALRELLTDTLLSPVALGRGLLEPGTVRGLVEDHLQGRRDRGRELWTLLTLELWHQQWIDRVPERSAAWQPPARVAAGAPV